MSAPIPPTTAPDPAFDAPASLRLAALELLSEYGAATEQQLRDYAAVERGDARTALVSLAFEGRAILRVYKTLETQDTGLPVYYLVRGVTA